jgi:hypothetical protein
MYYRRHGRTLCTRGTWYDSMYRRGHVSVELFVPQRGKVLCRKIVGYVGFE